MQQLKVNNVLIIPLFMLIGVMFLIHYLAVAQAHDHLLTDGNNLIVDGDELQFKDVDELRKIHPNAQNWQPHKYGDTDFVFCTFDYPAINSSSTNIHGYFLDKEVKAWKHLITYRVRGAGKVGFQFDDTKGICILQSQSASFKDNQIGVVNLHVAN
ncbi:MAG: hypothetical protein ACAI35_25645 [Candidatus Methylacidiphilales bacterium]|nr:hypothetical protein [Candidatus Methylacidiphilales bacterium]